MALKPTAGTQMALRRENSWDVRRFSRGTRENTTEGVWIPAASFSRAENWTFLPAKCLAQAEEPGIRLEQCCRWPRVTQLEPESWACRIQPHPTSVPEGALEVLIPCCTAGRALRAEGE